MPTILPSPASSNSTQVYWSARRDPNNSFGYGLMRRTNAVLEAISRHAPGATPLDVVDFGCAEGEMLAHVAQRLGERFRSGIGVDIFRNGMPASAPVPGMRFERMDLFSEYPYPLPDASADVVVVSAFIKHHPDAGRFLAEVGRILRPGGIAVVLDPRPLVVHVGALFGRFDKSNVRSLWGRAEMRRFAERAGRDLRLVDFERYWAAPTARLYRLGMEQWLPGPLLRQVALHQRAVLKRV